MPTGCGRRLGGVGVIFFCKALVFPSYLLNLKSSKTWYNVGLWKQGVGQPEKMRFFGEDCPITSCLTRCCVAFPGKGESAMEGQVLQTLFYPFIFWCFLFLFNDTEIAPPSLVKSAGQMSDVETASLFPSHIMTNGKRVWMKPGTAEGETKQVFYPHPSRSCWNLVCS